MKTILAYALAIPALLANAASIAPRALKQQTANFDDIKVVLPVASLQPIGTYKSLAWDGFNVINVGSSPTGVLAQTKPNVAVQYLLSAGGSKATLRPASSAVKYFSLQSFYFGCVAGTQETVVGVPVACTVKLTGRKGGKVVVTQQISFSPDSLLTSKMKKQAFAGKWADVDEVVFEQAGVLAAASMGVLYDNVQFTTFTL